MPMCHLYSPKPNAIAAIITIPIILSMASCDSDVLTSISLITAHTDVTPKHNTNSFIDCG